MFESLPGLPDIVQARVRLHGILTHTPVLPLQPVEGAGMSLWVKCENLQRTGSFKIRGAYNCIARLDAAARSRGVVAYSSGNHAQGVACAAALLGVPATVVMPENAIGAKVAATRAYGAEIIFAGTDSETRRRHAEDLAQARGAALVPPYDHADVIAGQGTLGLEILDALPEVRQVLVPIGGGGLIAGVAIAIKALRPDVRVLGVEPEGAADAGASWREHRIVELEHVATIADGLRAHRIGALPFAALGQYVDDVLAVPDNAILQAAALLLRRLHVVAEPSGAVALAAAMAGNWSGQTVAIISGGNIDAGLLSQLADSTVLSS
jgi:threonine dehydratase